MPDLVATFMVLMYLEETFLISISLFLYRFLYSVLMNINFVKFRHPEILHC